MDNKDNEMEIDLLQLAKALWHRAWVIALTALLCGCIAFSCSYFLITPLYQASAMMYVNNNTNAGNTSVTASDLTAAKSLVDTYIVILQSRTTLEETIERANLSYTYEELYEMVSADAVNGVEAFQIVVTSPYPQEAKLIANTIAEILPVIIPDIVEGSSVRIVDYAVTPTEKSSPNNTRNTALGAIVGFVVSCAVIILRELVDEQIRDEDYLLQTYDLPVLAVIPDLLNASKSSGKDYYSYRSHESSGKEAKS